MNVSAQADDSKVAQLLAHYASSHRHPTNERIHCVAVPLIMFSLVGMMYSMSPWLAAAFIAASMVYYLRIQLSAGLLLSMAAASALMLFAAYFLGAQGLLLGASVVIFVVAWVFQFIGHKLEGKKPSFFEDIQYLWIGPLFVLRCLFPGLR